VFFLGLLILQLSTVLANPCAENTGILFVPAQECDKYYTCVDDQAFPQTCPEGFYFDFEAQMCNPSDEVECNWPPVNPCEGMAQWTFVPRPNGGCGAYYRCENGVGVPLDCPDGFYFDVVNQKCNFPELTECDSNGDNNPPTAPTPPATEPTEPTTTTEETTTTTTEATTTTVPTAPTAPSTTVDPPPPPPTTQPPPPTEFSCVGRPDGSFIPDPPRGCTAFIRCENGVGTAFFCDAPFYFDYPRQMCNWRENVDCVSFKWLSESDE
jgi:hypothetical protein